MKIKRMVKRVLRKILGIEKTTNNKKRKKLNMNFITKKNSKYHSTIPTEIIDFAREYAKRNSKYEVY